MVTNVLVGSMKVSVMVVPVESTKAVEMVPPENVRLVILPCASTPESRNVVEEMALAPFAETHCTMVARLSPFTARFEI